MSESEQELDAIIEAYRDALSAYVQGDPGPVLTLWSEAEDATLANPFGPPCRGREAIESASRQAVANFMDGGILQFQSVTTRFDEVVRYGTGTSAMSSRSSTMREHWLRGRPGWSSFGLR